MSGEEDEDERDEDEDEGLPWEESARAAISWAINSAERNHDAGTVTVKSDYWDERGRGGGSRTFESLEELRAELVQLGDSEINSSVPWENGPVFSTDSDHLVDDALESSGLADFFAQHEHRDDEEVDDEEQGVGRDGDVGGQRVAITMVDGRLRLVTLESNGDFRFVDAFENRHGVLLVSQEALKLRAAIEELEDLMNSASVRELDFQGFFERNPAFLLQEGHVRARPHLALEGEPDGSNMIPDFFLEPEEQDGFADVLEIKLPSSGVFVKKQSRLRYSAAVTEACAQLREYGAYFDEKTNREAMRKKYGLWAYRPRLFLIIGRRESVDPLAARRAEDVLVRGLEIRTYDDLLDRVKRRLRP